ncbi:MAG: IS5 family transposase [Rhodovulum sp.]|nr:IS5 family transposase [Rhodovulum sp.]
MRGADAAAGSLFSYVDLEARIPAQHPLRLIREVVNEVLAALDAEFAAMYAAIGRPSIAPEKLLRGSLIQAFFTIRSERQLMEQLDYNLLFRWFVGLGIDDPVWDHSTYSKNRDRLLEADIARLLLQVILAHPKVAPLLSDEHFTVDGTLLQAWASMKSFVPKEPPPPAAGAPPPAVGDGSEPPAREPDPQARETAPEPSPKPAADLTSPEETTAMQTAADTEKRSRNAEVDFHGSKRANATHCSTTDPEARLFRKGKGKEAKLCFMGHALSENRHGLIVETGTTQATGRAEREAATAMLESHSPGSERRLTLGADKAYDTVDFVTGLRRMCVTPHVAQNTTSRASAIDGRTTRHDGYAVSQKKRKLIEEAFGWGKTIGGLARPMRRGVARMGFAFTFAMAAYDLVRLPRLLAEAAA